MPFQPGATLYTQAFGSRPESVEVPHLDIRAPTTSDVLYPIGKHWVNTVANTEYTLTSQSASNGLTTSNWTLAGASSTLGTLTGDSGGAISPTGSNINLLGTANQITTTGAGSTITWSLPSAIIAPGSLTTTTSLAATTTVTAGTGITSTTGNITATAGNVVAGAAVTAATTVTAGTGITSTTGNIVATAGQVNAGTSMTAGTSITATLGAITATNGNLILTAAGNKQVYGSVGTNATAGANSAGSVALIGGTIVVATTAVTANSLIRLTCQDLGTVIVPSALCVSAKTAGVNFTILASAATDTSTIFWEIVN